MLHPTLLFMNRPNKSESAISVYSECVAAVKRLHVHVFLFVFCAVYYFWSFANAEFIFVLFENRILLNHGLETTRGVALYIIDSAHEKTYNKTCD